MGSYNTKSKLYTSSIQWHRVNILILKIKEQDMTKKKWTKAKPSRENTKSFSSRYGIWGLWWSHLGSKELGKSHPLALPLATHTASCTCSLWLHSFLHHSSADIPMVLTTPKSCVFHCTLGFIFSFMQWHPPRGLSCVAWPWWPSETFTQAFMTPSLWHCSCL